MRLSLFSALLRFDLELGFPEPEPVEEEEPETPVLFAKDGGSFEREGFGFYGPE